MTNRIKKLSKKSFGHPSESGQVLIVILAFVLLLSILAVALLTRSLSDMAISTAGDNQVKIELTAQGVVSQITSDLQQEIAAGSYAPGATPYNAPSGVYYPLSNQFSVPSPSIGGLSAPTTGCGYENLVKMSYYGTPFYTNTASGTYNAAFTVPNRAAKASTLTPSLNSRYISTTSWQLPCLTLATSPAFGTSANSPNWVLMAKDGSNGVPGAQTGPAAFDSSYAFIPSVPPSVAPALGKAGSNPVLQRYAYSIYDEGSTLDMNVAGGPVSSTATAISPIFPYKNALSYADLTQLPGLSTLSSADQAQVINAIVGWRNNASSLALGNFPAYTFPSHSGVTLTPFDSSILGNNTGFLMVGNTALSVNGVAQSASGTGMSDQPFASRQQLIQFLQSIGSANTSGGVPSFTPTVQQQVLTCMGTFTRDINQPSYAPNPSRPLVVGNALSGGNSAFGADNQINPPFLNVTVSSGGWTRNDGTLSVTGEPLVKKRFALNKLAWLTYAGPSANRHLTAPSSAPGTSDYDVYQLETTYGISQAFLQQGTPANIYKYFGLSWVSDPNSSAFEWVYTHGDGSTSPFPNNNPTAGPIKGLTTVNTLPTGRDPDFFETLKASLCVGSLAKPYTVPLSQLATAYTVSDSPEDYYGQQDADVDNAIIQIGANIISQYQPSGYPARILFNDGLFGTGIVLEHRGVVDLPYIYGAQEANLRTADSTPPYLNCPEVNPSTSVPPAAPKPGTAYDVQTPIIWNPHAWNSANTDANPRPTNFRIYAVSADPIGNTTNTPPLECKWRDAKININYSPAIPNKSFGATDTEMDFNIPSGDSYLFREPTVLMKPGVPAGSNLGISTGNWITTLGGNSLTSLDPACCYLGTSTTGTSAPIITDDKKYIGMVLGETSLPLTWSASVVAGAADGTTPTSSQSICGVAESIHLLNGVGGASEYLTYYLQYEDATGNWITYDQKYSPICQSVDFGGWNPVPAPPPNANSSFYLFNQVTPGQMAVVCFDPRTSRWGMNFMGCSGRGPAFMQWAVAHAYTSAFKPYALPGWAAPVSGSQSTAGNILNAACQSAIWTTRPDEYQGFLTVNNDGSPWESGPSGGPTAGGWYPPSTNFANGNSWAYMRPGLVCQNNMAVSTTSYFSYVYGNRYVNDKTTVQPNNQYGLGSFADPDGVVRRGMSAYVPPSPVGTSGLAASQSASSAGAASGIPLKVAYIFGGNGTFTAPGTITPTADATSRPIVLNRPFHSVADIGYVFSDTPWRNLDFSTPESGNVALLDAFCINDTSSPNALVAGKVNLNTRQVAVIESVLSGAYKDEWNCLPTSPTTNFINNTGSTTTAVVAKGLVNRTSITMTGGGPLTNLGDLVGSWNAAVTNPSISPSPNMTTIAGPGTMIDGSQSYIGFSGTATTNLSPPTSPPNLSAILSSDSTVMGHNFNDVTRLREATIRALANAGETRVWNLMVDLVVQTGRYPVSSTSLDSFVVESQKRYWVHLAIDRMTGKVVDKQVEDVVQ